MNVLLNLLSNNPIMLTAQVENKITELFENSSTADFSYENFEEINTFLAFQPNMDFFNQVSIKNIVFFLRKTHQYFLNKKLLEIEQTIGQSYGDDVFSLFMQRFFNDLKSNLIAHIQMEEKKLFPYLLKLEAQKLNNTTSESVTNIYSISEYEKTHNNDIEDQITNVKNIIMKTFENAKNPLAFKLLINKLDTFELELRLHGLIEDEVLIPKAIQLEKE